MAVVLRMKRVGTIKQPHFRIVAMSKSVRRDGKVIEEVGLYDPKKKKDSFSLKTDRIQYWLKMGAVPSETVKSFLKKQKII